MKRFGDGFPKSGDPCQRVGETEATVDFLDDSATLVGCPNKETASQIKGQAVGEVNGVILILVPHGDTIASDSTANGEGDVKVPDTKYNATASVPCVNVGSADATCPAGVTRSPDQIAVEIQLPKRRQRVLLFDGKGKFVTHSSSQADGSAALQSSATRRDDWTIVTVGKEEYRIPDAFVLGD
ncbi:hypothetical protein H9L15_03500 [Sphingomonas daechungensis]|uniref:Uncharacterized protein n=1 Tax=Sphingomonas daechungensis TaxID=1176646 RepID=A0ABX6T7U9_9SPHN|nr:hypothetical protein [Sphingomonas daechungensis]QNP43743.1 hypothetical protein H9L15_03500 [Sphingomonas daechungensis]